MIERPKILLGGLLAVLAAVAAGGKADPVSGEVAVERIASHDGAHCYNPRLSADGRWLAYEVGQLKSRKQFILDLKNRAGPREIRVDGGGSKIRDRIKGRGGEAPTLCNELSFQTGGGSGFVLSCDGGSQNLDLFWLPSADRQPIRITHDAANDYLPALGGPEGRSLLFTSSRSGQGDLYRLELPLPPEGSDSSTRRLTRDEAASEIGPVWSPKGDFVTFVRHSSKGETDLWRMAPDGSRPTQITRWKGIESNPSWSPDGKQIAFFADHGRAGRFDLYVKSVASSDEPRLVAEDVVKADRTGPAWTPDGKGIVVARKAPPENPLLIVWIGATLRWTPLSTATVLNTDPVIGVEPGGKRWQIAFIAQGTAKDEQMRWYQVFLTTMDAELGAKPSR